MKIREDAKSYRFQRFGKYLVCLNQSLPDAIRFFLTGFNSVRLDSLGLSRAQARTALRAVILSKIRSFAAQSSVDLPVFGHIAIQVHRGYKVFDFGEGKVTKSFDEDVPGIYLHREISACKRASQIDAAPRFFGTDEAPVRFTEEYIPGTLGTMTEVARSGNFIEFYGEVEKCLLSLIAHDERPVVNSTEYIDSLFDEAFRGAWLKNNIESDTVAQVTSYRRALAAWLHRSAETKGLQLVQSHGDFSLVNAILTDDGLRFIDWEGLSPGCLYSDILNFAFVERYYERTESNLIEELPSMLQRYRAAVASRYPELSDAADINLDFARRLYYLERLSLLCGREASKNLSKVVIRSIRIFQDYDADAGLQALDC